MPVLQQGNLPSSLLFTESVTSPSDNIMSLAASATAYLDSNPDLQADYTSPVYPHEVGEVFNQETKMHEQIDQQISEE